MPGALWWRRFYEEERLRLGEEGLSRLFGTAPQVRLLRGGALVFPHARLSGCGPQVAAVALAVVESGCEEVLALGALHGGREVDSAEVARARTGSGEALARLRRIHGPGAQGDDPCWAEEFSLDGFLALLRIASHAAGRTPPRVIARFPFLVGGNPENLPGLDELRDLVARGVPIVATADHLHHGLGYSTPREASLPRDDPRAHVMARTAIEASFVLLRSGNIAGFLRLAEEIRSDFRDVGPVLATLLSERGAWTASVAALDLVPYADVLECEDPTWVAAALVEVVPRQAGAV